MKQLTASLLIAMSLVAVGVYAAPDQGMRGQSGAIEQLNLNDEREAEVNALLETYRDKRKAMHKAHRAEMKALRQEQKTALAGVLTEEEMAVLEAQWAEHRERKAEHKHRWQQKHQGASSESRRDD